MTNPNDTLDKIDREVIEELAKAGFAQHKPTHHKTADLYQVRLPSQKECCIKLFQPDFLELYVIENHALRSLSLTGRVSPVLYGYPDAGSPVPYGLGVRCFLVKPLYRNFLDNRAKRTRLLDDAAQLVGLAALLRREGWYDFDENWDNEAFDKDGRLIRFDMDAAFNYKSLSPKADLTFQAPQAYEQHQRLSEACKELEREDVVLLTAAVKTCRFLLDRRGNFPELIYHLSAAAPAASAGDGTAHASGSPTKWPRKVGAAVTKSLRGLSGASSSQTVSIKPPAGAAQAQASAKMDAPSEQEEKQWLALWGERLVGKLEPRFFPLKAAESNFLGLMFGHILSGKATDWKVEDLHHSLLLLLAGNLQRLAAEYAEVDPQVFRTLVEELYEFKSFTLAQARELTKRPKEEPPGPTTGLRIGMDDVVLAGNAWPATRKQGMEGCEDIVLKYEQAPFPFFVLADGETNARGGDAVKELAEQCRQLYEEMKRQPDARTPKDWVTLLVKRTNEALLRLGARTTAAVAMLSNKPVASVVLAQFGNSPWVFAKDDPGGGTPHAQENQRKCDDKVLGKSAIPSDEWIAEEINEIPLEAGSYHIRAYSDGIPQTLRSIFKESATINYIVEEVNRWGNERSADVGYDDRSVAGFDFGVSEVTIQPVKRKRESQPVAPGAIDWLSLCEGVSPAPFKLSPPARAFWQRALSTVLCMELRQYQVFKEAGLVVDEAVVVSTAAAQKPETPKPQPVVTTSELQEKTERPVGPLRLRWSLFWEWLRGNAFYLALLLVIVGIIAVCAYIIWFYNYRGASDNTNGNTLTRTTGPTPLPTPIPSFNNPEVRDLFNTLNTEGVADSGPLPPGDGVDTEPLKRLIPALAEILNKTQWRVKLEIHTSLSGDEASNFTTARDRGRRIVSRLKELGIPESRVSNEPKGDTEPLYPKPKTDLEGQQNRRIVIKVLK